MDKDTLKRLILELIHAVYDHAYAEMNYQDDPTDETEMKEKKAAQNNLNVQDVLLAYIDSMEELNAKTN